MPGPDGLDLVELSDTHLDGACTLVAEAGWNQLVEDWRLFMRAGRAIGFVTPDGQLVASAATIPCGASFGWVSMVLVTQAWRRRGLATELLAVCMEHTRAEGRVACLDATPAGEQVYRRLGFEGQLGLQRWFRPALAVPAASIPPGDACRRLTPDDLADVLAYDRDVFGGDRGATLTDLAGREASPAWVMRDGSGFLMSRAGRNAHQIGPISAEHAEAALSLMRAALAELTGPVLIDVPDRHERLVAFLKENGFSSERPFLRMGLGHSQPFCDPDRMFAPVGPEFG